jgi:hypothetical protein
VKFVPISVPLSATVSCSFQNAKPAAIVGSLYLRRLIDTGKEKEASTIRELCPTSAAINERDFEED